LLVHPRNPRVRRVWIAVELAAIVIAIGVLAWRASSGAGVTTQLVDISGFNEDLKVWMRFDVTLDLTNETSRTIGIERIDVEPDLERFNEAYGQAVPILAPPLLIEAAATTRYRAAVTLLNSAQLPEGTYEVIFRVRVETEDGDTYLQEFPAQFDHSLSPETRALRR
jgi:hypothetical protein